MFLLSGIWDMDLDLGSLSDHTVTNKWTLNIYNNKVNFNVQNVAQTIYLNAIGKYVSK